MWDRKPLGLLFVFAKLLAVGQTAYAKSQIRERARARERTGKRVQSKE